MSDNPGKTVFEHASSPHIHTHVRSTKMNNLQYAYNKIYVCMFVCMQFLIVFVCNIIVLFVKFWAVLSDFSASLWYVSILFEGSSVVQSCPEISKS